MKIRKNSLCLLAFFFFLQVSSVALGKSKNSFLGTHHAKGEQHEGIISMIQNCKGEPFCSPTGPFATLLGIVIEFKNRGYTMYRDDNLIKRELDLLGEEPYEPSREVIARGVWDFGRETLTIIRRMNSDEDKKFNYKHISSTAEVILLKGIDANEEHLRLERLPQ